MVTSPQPEQQARALARAWARAVAAQGYVPISAAETEQLLQDPSRDLVALAARGAAGQAVELEPAARAGAALVEAHLTDPGALTSTLIVLGTDLADGPHLLPLLSAVAGGFARALRSQTLLEQERLAKAVFDALTQAERAARDSETRFRAVFSGTAMGIGISDTEGRIVEVNQAFADLLGYRLDEMRHVRVPELTHPQDPPEMWENYARMMRGEFDYIRMDKAYYRKDGTEVWTDLTVSLIRDDTGRPQVTVAMVNDVTERHHLQGRLRHLAMYDPLTGLPNRTMFGERLAGAVGTADPATRVGVCFLDLDGFKQLNDRLGHHVGDQVLVAVAARLRECTSQRGHLVARMGGDEFVILVERSAGVEQLTELAEAVRDTLAEPVVIGPHRLRVSASIGVVDRAAAETDQAEILKAADVTLYRAKAAGRGQWALHDPDRAAEQVARYALAAALPDAVDRGEFSLVYQPIVALPSLAPRGVEALVRWHHPRLGELTPDQFIDLAEDTGQIIPLGRYVLREACRQLAAWRGQFPGIDMFVSVNLAVAQTQDSALVEDVQAILAETGLKPNRLQLELTESALMASTGVPMQALRTLTDSGVHVAIDDFGTGYSSLAYLRSLPVDALKLAAPFVEGLGEVGGSHQMDEQIVDALIRLAHAIDLTVTAEGVETRAQSDRLSALGCDCAQGWYCGLPQPASDLTRMLQRTAVHQRPRP
jgi:diguanylate cyclase (GGDEF)-like protein/PAS domain S-box-containing protein